MNIGGYDDSSFSESDGNRILGEILEAKKLIKVHFAELDKTPNYDGFFELCESGKNKRIPIGRLDVQIKTISSDYSNMNKKESVSDYKYPCETKIFNSVKKGISCNPAILFLVDVIKKKVYYIHVSPQYVFSLNLEDEENKVIYFNESDRLDEETFYEDFCKIYAKHRHLVYSEIESSITVSDDLDSETLAMLQDIIDNFNNAFNNELLFIKNHSYPRVWKFGIAYVKHNDASATVGIYKVLRGENGSLIRKFTKEESENCETISYFKLSRKTIIEIIDDFMFSMIDDYFDKSYINPKFLTQNILEEITFYFLDSIAKCCNSFSRSKQYNVYYKDIVPTIEVIELWNALIEYSLETSSYFSLKPEEQRFSAIKMDPLESLHTGYDSERRQRIFEDVVKHPTGKRPKGVALILEGTFAYRLVQRVIQELSERSIDAVSRIWEPQNFDEFFKELEQARAVGIDRYETGYTLADFSQNLQKILAELPETYSQVNLNLLGKYSATIKISGEYLFYIEPSHEAKCVQINLPSTDFRISQPDDIKGIYNSEDVYNSIKVLYPNCLSIAQTSLCNTFSKPYPLYQNVNFLIKQSIYRYFKRKMPYSHSFTPLIR